MSTSRRKLTHRLLIVCATVAVCGAVGAGPAAAAATPPSATTPSTVSTAAGAGDLLGLGELLGLNLGGSGQPADQNSGVTNALRSLPVLGPIVGGVVDDALPLLGSGTSGKPVQSAPAPVSGAVAPPSADTHKVPPTTLVRNGSTWTAPHTTGSGETAPVVPAASEHKSVKSVASDAFQHVASLLPSTAAGKAEMGAAAVALIVLGGVAVAGAAGAAGFASRRQFVGGSW